MARGRRILRRALIALVLFGVLLAVAAVFADHYLFDAGHLARRAESIVADRTGMELHIGRLESSWYPTRVVASDVTLASLDATASANRVVVDFDLSGLFSREIVITAGEIEGLVARFPEDVRMWHEIVSNVTKRLKETRRGPGVIAVSIETVHSAARVYLSEDSVTPALADVRLDDLMTDRIGVFADASLDAWGEGARLYGDVEVLRAEPGSPWQAEGEAWLAGIRTEQLPLKNMPVGLFAGRFAFAPTDAGPGVEMHARLDAPERPELTGDLRASGVWDGERAKISHAEWFSPGAYAKGSANVASPDDWEISVDEAHAAEGPLDALLALMERPRARFEADSDATVTVRDLDMDSIGGDLEFARGDLQFAGISVLPISTDAAHKTSVGATRSLRGSMSAANGVVNITEIRGSGFRIEGTVTPDRERQAVLVDLSADADLAKLPWTILNEAGTLERAEGNATVTRLKATFARGERVPNDLVIEGQLREASIRYLDNNLTIDLNDLNGQFTSDGTHVVTSATGRDVSGAPLTFDGKYNVKERRWTATLEGDPAPIVLTLFENTGYVQHAAAVARAAGPSQLDFDLRLPAKEGDRTRLDIARHDDGGADAALQFVFGNSLDSMKIQVELPADRFFNEYLPNMDASGTVQSDLVYNKAKKQYTLSVDASNAAIESNTILQKDAGTPFTLKVAAGATGKKWVIQSAEAQVDGKPLLTRTAPTKDGSFPFEIDLVALPPLLPDGATSTGIVRGRFRPDPLEGELEFVDATLALNSTLTFDRINGRMAFAPGTFRCDDMAIRGARSECVLSLSRTDGRWTGHAKGPRLDVEAVSELVDALRVLRPGVHREGPSGVSRSMWDRPTLGEFTLDVDELYYRRGKLDTFHVRVLGEERAVRLTEFSAQPGEGTIYGSLVILPDNNHDAVVKSAVKFERFDSGILNDLVFPEDRGFFGRFDGEFTFDAPMGSLEEMLAGGHGTAKFVGKDGSLGRIGFASRLLTVLKTTEVINLRAPTLRDKGLVFNKVSGGIIMDNGVMMLDNVKLDGGAYKIEATGDIDFAKDVTNVDAYVRVLESIGRIVRRIPLIGGLATALSTDLVGVPVHFGGSPYDVQVDIVFAAGKSVATTPLRAGEGAMKAVGDTFKQLIPGGNKEKDDD